MMMANSIWMEIAIGFNNDETTTLPCHPEKPPTTGPEERDKYSGEAAEIFKGEDGHEKNHQSQEDTAQSIYIFDPGQGQIEKAGVESGGS